MRWRSPQTLAWFAALAILALPALAMAQDAAAEAPAVTPPTVADALAASDEVKFLVNNLWIMLAGCLVFIMHLGFATLESGLTRAKNTTNILFKNTMIVCIGLLTYALIGFNLMYPATGTHFGGFLNFDSIPNFISINPDEASEAFQNNQTSAYGSYTWYTDFFFQAMFAATCCTIVSGAVAGRIKLSTFLIFSLLFVSISYPITGYWKWGAGWLHVFGNSAEQIAAMNNGEEVDAVGFYDFAGSTIVHSVGGWGALIMAFLLGPRKGKYVNGKSRAIPGHNLPLAAIGVFLLWFGWFGFNGGSVLSADANLVSLVLVTTSMAAAAGGVAAAMTSWFMSKKPDLTMALNGILAGLVGITAGADQMQIWEAVVIGLIAGVLVYFAVLFVDQILKVDDPVGAISVHLVCGIWGTLAVGIFGALAGGDQLMYQIVGILSIGVFTALFAGVLGVILKATMGLRVSEKEEMQGLDIGEHGMEAYAGFQTFSNI